MKNIIHIAAVSLAMGLGTSAVQAGSSNSSLIREAHRVVDYSDDLKHEVVRHFRHTREYRHLLSDAAKIRSEAKHIDKLSHSVRSSSDVRYLRADLRDLDKLVHHVGDLIADIDRDQCRGGRVHGDVRHVKALVAKMNRSLHTMEAIVDSLDRRFRYQQRECEVRTSHTSRSSRGSHSSHQRSHKPTSSHRSSSHRSVGEQIAGQVLREVLRRR